MEISDCPYIIVQIPEKECACYPTNKRCVTIICSLFCFALCWTTIVIAIILHKNGLL